MLLEAEKAAEKAVDGVYISWGAVGAVAAWVGVIGAWIASSVKSSFRADLANSLDQFRKDIEGKFVASGVCNERHSRVATLDVTIQDLQKQGSGSCPDLAQFRKDTDARFASWNERFKSLEERVEEVSIYAHRKYHDINNSLAKIMAHIEIRLGELTGMFPKRSNSRSSNSKRKVSVDEAP